MLLVIHDMARMPRTRAALRGLPPGRPWDEVNTQLEILDIRLQLLLSVMWVGGRLQGEPPAIQPYPSPKPKDKTTAGEQEQRRPDPRKQAYLDRFAPPKRHLKLVKPQE